MKCGAGLSPYCLNLQECRDGPAASGVEPHSFWDISNRASLSPELSFSPKLLPLQISPHWDLARFVRNGPASQGSRSWATPGAEPLPLSHTTIESISKTNQVETLIIKKPKDNSTYKAPLVELISVEGLWRWLVNWPNPFNKRQSLSDL